MEVFAMKRCGIGFRWTVAGQGLWLAFSIATVTTTITVGLAAWLVALAIVGEVPNRFRSPYFEFELPANWRCVQKGKDAVCRFGKPPSSAIIILTTKERGPTDSIDTYIEHLSKPISRQAMDGRPAGKSKVISFGTNWIGGRSWTTAQHLDSEVENFYTDYCITMTASLAILVTFSVHKNSTDVFRSEFNGMIKSLKVYQGYL
jgi:hypothetical protein